MSEDYIKQAVSKPATMRQRKSCIADHALLPRTHLSLLADRCCSISSWTMLTLPPLTGRWCKSPTPVTPSVNEAEAHLASSRQSASSPLPTACPCAGVLPARLPLMDTRGTSEKERLSPAPPRIDGRLLASPPCERLLRGWPHPGPIDVRLWRGFTLTGAMQPSGPLAKGVG